MTLEQINERVSQLNNEVARLNSQRAVNLGKRETLQAQLDSAIRAYNDAYGASIDVSTLDSEIASVTADTEKAVMHMEKVLACINSGDIAGAEQLLGVEQSSTAQQAVAPHVEATPQAVAEPVVEPVVTPPVIEPVVNTVPAPPQASAIPQIVIEPVVQEFVTPQAAVEPVVVSPVEVVAPPPVNDASPAPMSFGAILGGTPFNPQGVN